MNLFFSSKKRAWFWCFFFFFKLLFFLWFLWAADIEMNSYAADCPFVSEGQRVRAVTERGPQGWLFLFFHVVMIGFSVTSEHRLMSKWGGFTWDELKVENYICSPPGRECRVVIVLYLKHSWVLIDLSVKVTSQVAKVFVEGLFNVWIPILKPRHWFHGQREFPV